MAEIALKLLLRSDFGRSETSGEIPQLLQRPEKSLCPKTLFHSNSRVSILRTAPHAIKLQQTAVPDSHGPRSTFRVTPLRACILMQIMAHSATTLHSSFHTIHPLSTRHDLAFYSPYSFASSLNFSPSL